MTNSTATILCADDHRLIIGDDELNALQLVQATVAIPSMLVSFFLVVSIYAFQNVRKNYGFQIVAMIALSDAMGSITFILQGYGLYDPDGINNNLETSVRSCQVLGAALQFFTLASVLWNGFYAVNMWATVVHGVDMRRYSWIPHVVIWGMCLASVLLIVFFNQLGPAGPWCWVCEKGVGQVLRWSTYFGWVFLVFIIALALYGHVLCKLRKVDEMRRLSLRLFVYMLAWILVHTVPLITRIDNLVHPSNPIFGLLLTDAVFAPAQGLLDSAAFGCNRKMSREYHAMCRRQRHSSSFGSFDTSLVGLSDSFIVKRDGPLLKDTDRVRE